MTGAREQARRLDLVSRWADDLAHEIKNPLHAMVINLELVKRRAAGGDAEDAVRRAEVVEAELQRVHVLVDSLLRLVRPWPNASTASVHEVLEALLPVIRARCHIRSIAYRQEAGSAIAAIAPGELAFLLVGLVDGVLEATPENGSIESFVESLEEEVRLTLRHAGPEGGPSPSGPKLASSERLVAELGGSVRVTVEEGVGAELVLTLPSTGAA